MSPHEIATIVGSVAAICTTIAFVPQAIKIIHTKHTQDLSPGMYTIFSSGVALWLCYGIMLREMPIILANGVTLIFTLTILVFILKYRQ